MGLQPTEFENMTPVEFRYAFDGWLAEKEENIIRSWEQTRFLAYYTMIINIKPENRKPMKAMFPMAWDSAEDMQEEPEVTYEERLRRVHKYRELMARAARKNTDESH